MSHANRTLALAKQGRVDEAIVEYRKALRIKPDYAEAYNDLGGELLLRGQVDEAMALYRQALEINPDYTDARNNLDRLLGARPSGRRLESNTASVVGVAPHPGGPSAAKPRPTPPPRKPIP